MKFKVSARFIETMTVDNGSRRVTYSVPQAYADKHNLMLAFRRGFHHRTSDFRAGNRALEHNSGYKPTSPSQRAFSEGYAAAEAQEAL